MTTTTQQWGVLFQVATRVPFSVAISTGVRVNEDSFIVLRAEVPGDDVIDVTIADGPDGTCACKVSTADGDLASAAPDVRGFEQVLAGRLAEAGVRAQTAEDRG